MAKVKRVCRQCDKEFFVFPSEIKKGGGKFCSRKCLNNSRKKVVKKCIECGIEFEVKPSVAINGGGQFCSYECYRESKKKIVKICEKCGKEFFVFPSVAEKGYGKFCSQECYSKSRKGVGNPNWKGGLIKQICMECGKEFAVLSIHVKKGKGKFCSHECHAKSRKRKLEKICAVCGKEFEVKPSDAKRGGGKFCSQECYTKWNKGGNNPNWKGGVSFEPYCEKFNNEFKEYIRKKFGRVCYLCPKTEVENGERLSVHHVNYNKACGCDDDETCQFVPLCRSCNSKVNNNRDMWEKKIKAKMKNKLNGWYI